LKKNYLILALISLYTTWLNAQANPRTTDSLLLKNYDYLYTRIEAYRQDSATAAPYIRTFLVKAKREQNWEETVTGYKNFLNYPGDQRLQYADSMVYAAGKTGDHATMASAYLTRGAVFYAHKMHKKALDNYTAAYKLLSRRREPYLWHKSCYSIAQVKYYLGYYEEAQELFSKCIHYFRQEDDRAYLNSLHSLGLCLNRTGSLDSCTAVNQKGLREGVRLKVMDMEPYFIHSEGINTFYKKEYNNAIKKLEQSLHRIIENEDFSNESVAYFYIGKSYVGLGDTLKALPYFLKVDGIFKKTHYIRPDLRENFEVLIDYAIRKHDSRKQLYYVNRLLKADSIIHADFRYLSGKIHKEYDTRELLVQKQAVEHELKGRKKYDLIYTTVILLLFILLLYGAFRYIKNKRRNRERFLQLMSQTAPPVSTIVPLEGIIEVEPVTLKPEVETAIVKQLEKFEKNKSFLAKDLTLARLAIVLETNTKYVSIVIHRHRKKRTDEYINDLKIDYLIMMLRVDRKYRNYTIKALSEEVGFNNVQSFKKAFVQRTELSPSFIIGELRRENGD
jgi:tetratricopeptide (TPR) repeat protein